MANINCVRRNVIVKNSFYMSDYPPIINEILRNSLHRFHNYCWWAIRRTI